MIKKGDIFIFGVILVIIIISSMGIYYYKSDKGDFDKVAVIKQGDIEVERIFIDDLDELKELELFKEYNVTIHAENGRIKFYKSDCPNQVCVNSGWISKKGEMAVCLPYQIIIKIEGADSGVDIVTH
ncbi:NusG domain II-containing protein [Herbivorax sp. ANBcel31]|uniref:NusG domain II-containing protein n=1 Tax=Herbivorax sp. ANBcel31 TaxID=3069754 RepID=UPI0027B1BEC1|nr:NusG domain II-containing protein [Herbivorax sp. ANBcel31]MDQ2087146.1 NusG domain II-containing protein [Herbivorax sp. ANBcel31]